MSIKQITKRWWFWLIVIIVLAIIFFFPMFQCGGCNCFPDSKGELNCGTCCQSLFKMIFSGGEWEAQQRFKKSRASLDFFYSQKDYFFFAFLAGFSVLDFLIVLALAPASFLAAAFSVIFLKRSTRPVVSRTFFLPVQKGWQALQISTFITSTVEPVLIMLPQAQII